MPLYDFQCPSCGCISEEFYKIAECPDTITCACSGVKSKVISSKIFRDEPIWLNDSVREVLQDSDAIRRKEVKPIENRTDYNRFMKAHPNIVPIG